MFCPGGRGPKKIRFFSEQKRTFFLKILKDLVEIRSIALVLGFSFNWIENTPIRKIQEVPFENGFADLGGGVPIFC